MKSTVCPTCSTEYKRIGSHWAQANCPYPQPTDEQMQILKGILLGDGSIPRTEGNPRFVVGMANSEYLEFIDSKFPVLGTGVNLMRDASQSAEYSREYDIVPGASSDDYEDIYRWEFRRTPHIKNLDDWYETGKKIFPEDLDMTPIILKHWFVCDGWTSKRWENPTVGIAAANEIKSVDKLVSYFDQSDCPSPSHVHEGAGKMELRWGAAETKEFFEYIGSPVPGFEYKWP